MEPDAAHLQDAPIPGGRAHGIGPVAWVLAMLAGAALVTAAAYAAVSSYVTARANDNIRNVLLSHRGLHHYIQRTMHPAFYAARDAGKVAPDYYDPIVFSSSYIVRVMHGFYNEERRKDGRLDIYYKMAADNPRNPVNLATPAESRLLRMFNEDRSLREYREVVKVDGQPFLLHAMPFLETEARCLRCHGHRQDAPPGLQAMYPGEGGFNEKAGVVRAVEIIRAPLSKERYSAVIGTGAFMGGFLGLSGLMLFNRRLRSMVRARTRALEGEVRERSRAEAEVRALNLELERRVEERTAQQVAANKELDSFAYSVSHDLRAPLRAVDGFSQALEEDCAGALDAEGRGHLARIRRGCTRMGELIEDLLQLSRYTRKELEVRDLDLSRKAAEIAEELQAAVPDRHADFVIQPGLKARGDAALVRAALQNLLGNAFKFSAKVASPRIEFGTAEVEGRTEYFVRDNGVGFDMAYADKLFGAFQRLHSADEFPGTGIGLATVQRILLRHGGSIRAESAPGAGATFYFTLGAR